ncbi:hypothetical protein Hanom_Chr02g00131171 [Helianthus anomalus]
MRRSKSQNIVVAIQKPKFLQHNKNKTKPETTEKKTTITTPKIYITRNNGSSSSSSSSTSIINLIIHQSSLQGVVATTAVLTCLDK